MTIRGVSAAAVVVAVVLTACGERAGLPETETTGTAQAAPSQTATASATTTASTGGSVANMVPADKEFVASAGASGLFEVQAANLVVKNGSSPDVNAFALRMVADHSRANDELRQLATIKGVVVPAELADPHADVIEELTPLTGEELDRAYMQHMMETHQRDVAEFERAAVTAQDQDVRAFAEKMLPVLKEHLALARETLAKL